MGFRAVGKSSISTRFAEGSFAGEYSPTIEGTYVRGLRLGGIEYEVEMVDTAGQDEYSVFQRRYGIGVDGYVLVYAINSPQSLELVRAINDKILDSIGADTVPRVLVGNKCDLTNQRRVSQQEGEAVAASWGCAHVECSAKANIGIDEVFSRLIEEIDRELVLPKEESSGCIVA